MANLAQIRTIFSCRNTSWADRIAAVNKFILPGICWGIDTVTHNANSLKDLDCVQISMYSKITIVKKTPNEETWSWIIRCKRQAKTFRDSLNIPAWSEFILGRHCEILGKIARLPSDRLSRRLLMWKNLNWWRTLQTTIPASGSHPLRHPHKSNRFTICKSEGVVRQVGSFAASELDRQDLEYNWSDLARKPKLWSRMVSGWLSSRKQ